MQDIGSFIEEKKNRHQIINLIFFYFILFHCMLVFEIQGVLNIYNRKMNDAEVTQQKD
jgi:hypothetical protein